MKNHVAHIGGIFIYSENAKSLAGWYTQHLGIAFKSFGEGSNNFVTYSYLDTENQKQFSAVFSILQSKNRPQLEFKPFCLNLRINDLETLVNELTQNGITVKPMEVYPEGKFAWISDPENNWIELWEDTAS